MKAISVRQPWAWMIVYGGKNIENRTWKTNYRGNILIHASAGMTGDEWDQAWNFSANINSDAGRRAALAHLSRKNVQRGGFVGTARIVDCVESDYSIWFEGPYGLVLHDVRPIEFVPYTGALGLFDVPDGIVANIKRIGG